MLSVIAQRVNHAGAGDMGLALMQDEVVPPIADRYVCSFNIPAVTFTDGICAIAIDNVEKVGARVAPNPNGPEVPDCPARG